MLHHPKYALCQRQICRQTQVGLFILTLLILAWMPDVALATRLQLDDDASNIAALGAALLLYLHIGGGTVGLLSGTLAIVSKKGSRAHRLSGRVFFVSMMVSYSIGALVAPFLSDGQRPNFVAGVLALTLLITGVLAAKRRNPTISWVEYTGAGSALAVVCAGVVFMVQASSDPTGTVDGSPPQAFVLFVLVGSVCVLEDIWLWFKGNIRGTTRIARHVWRMCMSLFIAAASFFLGQEQFLPSEMIGTLAQFGPVLFPPIAMVIWLILIRLPNNRLKR